MLLGGTTEFGRRPGAAPAAGTVDRMEAPAAEADIARFDGCRMCNGFSCACPYTSGWPMLDVERSDHAGV